MTPEAAGLLTALAVLALCLPLQVALWPRALRWMGEGDEARPYDLVRCDRCGKPVLSDAMTLHRRRCAGYLRSSRERSYQRRRW